MSKKVYERFVLPSYYIYNEFIAAINTCVPLLLVKTLNPGHLGDEGIDVYDADTVPAGHPLFFL
ncbi:MAG: hypothetical protein H8E17_19465 [Deltaproteobacteria bacterium]|nr:hypothetical protein [Deltaproteobacteria bacterium]